MTDYSIYLSESWILDIELAAAPVGDWYGAVVVNGTAHKLEQINDVKYQCKLFGGRVGRCNLATVYVVVGDTTGVTVNSADRLTVTAQSEPWIPQPREWVKTVLELDWDTTFLDLPVIEMQEDMKSRRSIQGLRYIHITLIEGLVKTQSHSQGRYKTNEYPVEIVVRSEGSKESDRLARDGMAEVKRIIEMNWNDILLPEFDYVRYDDDAVPLHIEYAGKYEWRWRIRIMGVYRGRAGTPADPS